MHLSETSGTHPVAGPRHFARLVMLRWTLLVALALLLQADAGADAFLRSGGIALGALALSNMILLVVGPALTAAPAVPLILAISDTLVCAIVIFAADISAPEMLFLFALVIFLVALGDDMKRIVTGTLAVAAVYWWFGSREGATSADIIATYLGRVTFLYCVALYFGYLAVNVRQERRLVEKNRQETRELHTILEIIETANSSLDLHKVMATIVGKICEVIRTDRCSVLFLDKDGERGWVIASSDSPEVDMLGVDLSKYPEVRRAVCSRSTVIVDDIETHPLMETVRQEVRDARFNSLVVIPLIFQDEALGTLLLRAASRTDPFTPDEIRFCQTVAGASVTALKNALLYREMRREADRHRSTAEKLRNVLESSMDVILTTDAEGNITDSNNAAEAALGYRREELLGRPLTEILGSAPDRREFVGRLRRSLTAFREATPLRRSDGNQTMMEVTFAAIRNDLGEMTGAVCVGKEPAPH